LEQSIGHPLIKAGVSKLRQSSENLEQIPRYCSAYSRMTTTATEGVSRMPHWPALPAIANGINE